MYFESDNCQDKLDLLVLIGRKNIKHDNLETLTTKELKRILLNSNTHITSYFIGNNCGEFLFVYFKINKTSYFVYGLGLHEPRQELYKNTWKFIVVDYDCTTKGTYIEASEVLEYMKVRKKKFG